MITKQRTIKNERGAVVAELRRTTKRFGVVEAVGDVNLTVRAGELLAVLAPNGAGCLPKYPPFRAPPLVCAGFDRNIGAGQAWTPRGIVVQAIGALKIGHSRAGNG